MNEAISTGSTAICEVPNAVGFFQHGWHSWCDSGWVDPSQPRSVVADPQERMGHDDPVHALDTTPGGSGVAAVDHGDGSISLLGALAGGAWVRRDGDRLVGTHESGAVTWVTLTGPERTVFSRYAELLAQHLGRRAGRPPRIWTSWYSMYGAVSEQAVHAALAELDGFDLDVIQIDDGWQRGVGDWQPNPDFPSGMADLAGRIVRPGRRAGLWLAPFITMPGSSLAAERPELLLRDAMGNPVVAGFNWGDAYWALDVTRPDTLDHLAELFSGYVEAGFGFFKLDFLYAAAFPGQHANPMSRSDAYRNACLRIRQTVGDDTYLLACGAPIIESIGIFDGIRVGPDVGRVWDDGSYAAARPAMAGSINRLWLRSAIDVDPDVVYFGTTGLSTDTMAHLQAIARITGFLGTSDLPGSLTADQRESLAAFLTDKTVVEQVSRYRWRVGDDEFDFSPALTPGAGEPIWGRPG